MSNDANYSGTYAVIGPPGTGKTTWLTSQVRAIVERFKSSTFEGNSPVLVSSLTKTAAAEVAGRDLPIPRDAIGTLHSHAFRSLGRPKIAIGTNLASWNDQFPDWAFSGVGRESSDDLDEINELGDGNSPGDDYMSAYDLVRHRMTPRDRWAFRGMRIGRVDGSLLSDFAEAFEEWKTSSETYDFTDLISGALNTETPVPLGAKVVIVDEAQDLSKLEWELVNWWAGCAGALIAVGDPWQALYSWRGAHPELFDDERIPKDRVRVLSQSYRVPGTIVSTALEWMRGRSNVKTAVEYQPRKDKSGNVVPGSIKFESTITPSNLDKMIMRVEDFVSSGKTVMIEATCSYMLYSTIEKLRQRGIPFANPWRLRRGDWNPISTRGTSVFARIAAFLSPTETRRVWTWKEIGLFVATIGAKNVLRHGAKAELERRAKERGDENATSIELAYYFLESSFLEVLRDMREHGATKDVVERAIGWIRSRLVEKNSKSFDFAGKCFLKFGVSVMNTKPSVYVGTIHSFKGAEADVVFMFTELSGSSRESWNSGSVEAKNAIARTFYVGMTRAREELVVCGSSSGADRSLSILKELQNASLIAGQ